MLVLMIVVVLGSKFCFGLVQFLAGTFTRSKFQPKALNPKPQAPNPKPLGFRKVKASQRSAKQAKITTCSWGRDAIPSEQPR